jgi:hypothetical protein
VKVLMRSLAICAATILTGCSNPLLPGVGEAAETACAKHGGLRTFEADFHTDVYHRWYNRVHAYCHDNRTIVEFRYYQRSR